MTVADIRRFTQHMRGFALAFAVGVAGAPGLAEPMHGIAMYGDPALPPDYEHLPQANPDAPKGGQITFAESGSYDSLHPVITKGSAPWQLRFMIFESLLGRNYDEPFTLYGLLAESVETGPNREWVEFTLREEARFSDGSPVTIEDVMWTFETLGTRGHPRYRGTWNAVESMEQTGPRSVRFTFNTDNRELALIMGLRPILKKAQWEGEDFERSGVTVKPIGSAPYVIGDFEQGRYLELERNPDYWGKDLPFMKGQANFDLIRYDFYTDSDVIFEAFKAGEADTYRESNPERWATQYDFPAVQDGDVVMSEIPHQRPTGIEGLVMNTRRAPFDDWRVRQAMIELFNFEFINQTLNGGREPRIQSYFSNSVLGMDVGEPAEGRVAELLAPFEDEVLPGTIDGYALPETDGSERNREGLARALDLLAEAGWTPKEGKMTNAEGEPLTFEILISSTATRNPARDRKIVQIYRGALAKAGIDVTVTSVDTAQYTDRTNSFDFDMTSFWRAVSLSPGNEQRLYWGSEAADQEGSRNWMGVESPAIDAMIDEMLSARSREDSRAATKALDRILTAGRYVIPIWYSDVSRIAHRKELHYPERLPMYGDWQGFLPDVWWYEEE
ncbi:MAG: extracellular solute-binding protein [Maritimibacter harenae]